jgi:hypothetical protein
MKNVPQLDQINEDSTGDRIALVGTLLSYKSSSSTAKTQLLLAASKNASLNMNSLYTQFHSHIPQTIVEGFDPEHMPLGIKTLGAHPGLAQHTLFNAHNKRTRADEQLEQTPENEKRRSFGPK